jgi:hypothetical protein
MEDEVMRPSILLGALALLAGPAFGANNLPAVCSNTAAEGQALSLCASSAQTFSAAVPASLVRSCSTVSCPYAERVWRKLSDVTSAQFVEVCTSDKAEGAAMTECQGTTTTTWGAMAMVAPAQVARAVEAEPPFPGTFTVTPNSGAAPLSVTIAWNVSSFSGATCTASGSWTGAKTLSGSQVVTNLTANASYTLTCSRSVRGSASLSWTAPTKNTDGSALTTLAGYRISYGQSASALTSTIQVPSPTTVNFIVGNLDANIWHFGVRAYTSTGVESELSNIVSKAVASTTETRSATREVAVTPPKPEPPVLQVVDNRVFNATPDYSRLAFIAGKQYGTVALGVRCDETKPVKGGWYPVPSSAVRWASLARTAYPVARCSTP